MFGIDRTGRLYIDVDKKPMGQLNIGQYVELELEKGKHQINLLHKDIFDFKSTHQIETDDKPTFLRVFAKITSNGIEVVPKPAGFESKYKRRAN